MNIYSLCTLFFLFINVETFYFLADKKSLRGLQLFMKKSKGSFSYLYQPKTMNQGAYFNYLNDESNKIIISTGPAGCGKTLFACQKAITQMKTQEIDKIIITRPMVTVEEEIGFLPGNIIKKMDPWTKPIFDIFLEFYSKTELDLMLYNGKIEICPLAFMRGRTFKNAFIIADEMQNSSPNQMKMLVTRLGVKSRMVITGDLKQTDFVKENGLHDFISRFENYNNTRLIKLVRLENEDIERSEIVKNVIEIYDYKNGNKPVITLKEISNTNASVLNTNANVTNTNDTNTSKNIAKRDDDAALIPKRRISRNHDIFFESSDF